MQSPPNNAYYSNNIKNSEIRRKGHRHALEWAAQARRTQLQVDKFIQKREAGKPEEESLLLRSSCRYVSNTKGDFI